QGLCRNAVAMGRQKRLSRCAGVITSAIVDQKQMLRGLRHNSPQERLVKLRGKLTFKALIEEASREILNGPKDLVAFALPPGGDLRLVLPSGPRVAARAPLGKPGFICKEDQAALPLGRLDKRRPLVLEPGEALGRVEMLHGNHY